MYLSEVPETQTYTRQTSEPQLPRLVVRYTVSVRFGLDAEADRSC